MYTTRKRTPTWAVHDTQDGWLALRRGGMSVEQIAAEAGVSAIRVRQGLAAARARTPDRGTSDPSPRRPSLSLTLAFGSSCKPLALLTCEDVHPHGPMPDGTRCCCAACYKTGVEDHPELRRTPRTEPKPEPSARSRTRKQRRKMARTA